LKNGRSGVEISKESEKMRRFCLKINIWRPIFDFEFKRFFANCGQTSSFKKKCKNTKHFCKISAQYIQKLSKSETKKLITLLCASAWREPNQRPSDLSADANLVERFRSS